MHTSHPLLPTFTLVCGRQRVVVADPRPDPLALGARYCHGGYVLEWWHGDRLLTGGPQPHWDRFDGRGLPETFELALGWAQAREGDEVLRIGTGRLRKTDRDVREISCRAPLCGTVTWEVVEHGADRVVMRCADGIDCQDFPLRYHLERTIVLSDDGLTSSTRLELLARPVGYALVTWFAHPFFAHSRLTASSLHLPASGTPTARPPGGPGGFFGPELIRDAGRWRFEKDAIGARTAIAGLWGGTHAGRIHLDPNCGSGVVSLDLDRPLDHVVIWGNDHVISLEPKLARTWLSSESAAWTLRYQLNA